MCGFQSEVRGRGERADSPLSLCRIPKARHISGSSQGDICEKLRATLPRALSCRIPFFRAGAKYHGIHHASRRPTAAPILRVGREGRRAGHVRTKRADNVEVPKLLRTFAMIETYGN